MKKNNVLKALALVFLFIGLSSLVFSDILPEAVEYSSPVAVVVVVYRLMGLLSFAYLGLVFVKNKKIWLTPEENYSERRGKLSWRSVLVLPVIFLAYYIFHLSMILTENINNKTFDFDYKSLNLELLVVFYLPLVFVILLAIFLVTRLPDKQSSWKVLDFAADIKVENVYMAVLVSLAFIDRMTERLIWDILFSPVHSEAPLDLVYANENILGSDDFLSLFGNMLLVFVVLCVLSFFIVRGIQAFKSNRASFSLALTTSLLLALVFNSLIQAGMSVDEGPMYYGYVVTGISLFQIFVLTLVFMFIYLLINRYMIATAVIMFVFGGFSLGNAMKFSVRQEPIYVSELSWLTNMQSLLSFVDLKLILLTLFVLLGIVLLVILLSRRFFKGKIMEWKTRAITLLLIFSLYFPVMQNFKHLNTPEEQVSFPLLSQYVQRYNGSLLWRGSAKLARDKSLSYVWLKKIYGEAMEEPVGYSQAKVEEIIQKYRKEADVINQSRSENIADQTVIYILSESLSNPNRIKGAKLSDNPLKNIDLIKASATGGLMYSNSFAGGTANMEAQSLSGLPMVNYSSNISTINSDVFPSMPFIPAISNFFPEKIALHPENAANYNRNTIYKKLGFDHFYALSNTEKANILINQEKLDGYVTDTQVYKEVLDKINPAQSQFFSVLTMQNHMSYENYSGSSSLTARGEGHTGEQNKHLQNYVRKISDTDRETKAFLEELEKMDKKITVVFYGDHLSNVFPTDYPSLKTEPFKAYQTDYFIWTNKGNASNKQGDLNAAEFAPALLETVDAKVSPYYALLSSIMWELPSEYNSALSAQVSLNEAQQERIEELKIIQYDLTSGKNYLKEDSSFFQLDK
ncbi:LTA synthase family protein [Lactococcus ileimucosae]|uniref:LTA synthase family protein n=1 Tax=Lactococcus ileimucosae TaxID=2941329 RepID=UPI002042CC79|nr:LTA synthase family protein [Lactococcus ileimucosae]